MIPSKIIVQRQFAKKDNDHAPEFQTCDHWQKNKLVRLFHTDLHTRNKRNLWCMALSGSVLCSVNDLRRAYAAAQFTVAELYSRTASDQTTPGKCPTVL